MKTKYTATFADGSTATRKSDRAYTAAYRVTFECDRWVENSDRKWVKDGTYRSAPYTGFSATRQLAEKAARAHGRDPRIEIVDAIAA